MRFVLLRNWLRDYSQVIDTGSLKVFDANTLVTVVTVLGYLQFGSSSGPFQVNSERLGVYLPVSASGTSQLEGIHLSTGWYEQVEHIDNPRNYADGQDARKYDPRLRPPVNPKELLIDSKTGMKNYMMNDSGGWDTSKAFIRRQLQAAATRGRAARAANSDEMKSEAYRLLGSAVSLLQSRTNNLRLTSYLPYSNMVAPPS